MKKLNSKQSKRYQKKKKNSKLKLKKPIFLVKQRWAVRKKTLSPYPYIMTISCHKKNVFFTVADIEGKTKTWTSTGRSGFKNKDKTTYLAVVRVTEVFFKKAWSWGIRHLILQFRNVYRRADRFAVKYSLRKLKPKIVFKYLGFVVYNQMAFNGCRKKKKTPQISFSKRLLYNYYKKAHRQNDSFTLSFESKSRNCGLFKKTVEKIDSELCSQLRNVSCLNLCVRQSQA